MSETGELTFAEAMALGPGEVETYHHGTGKWVSMQTAELQTLATMRRCEFRRAGSNWELPKPLRSRVQEMADEYSSLGDRSIEVIKNSMDVAIREVCKYLRAEPHNSTSWAGDIEREFLVPR